MEGDGVLLVLALAALVNMYDDEGKALYTALGDSLAVGIAAFGKQGYVYRYHKWLKMNKFANRLKLYNAGILGLNSSGLVNRIYNNARLQEAIRNSSVLTLDIGANDIIESCKEANLLKSSASMFEVNFYNTLEAIRTLNRSAHLYVMDIYNPYPKDTEQYEASETWISEFNRIIINACNKPVYKVNGLAEVYKAFKGNECEFTLITIGNKHPNTYGHSVISRCFEQITV